VYFANPNGKQVRYLTFNIGHRRPELSTCTTIAPGSREGDSTDTSIPLGGAIVPDSDETRWKSGG